MSQVLYHNIGIFACYIQLDGEHIWPLTFLYKGKQVTTESISKANKAISTYLFRIIIVIRNREKYQW